MPNRRARRGGGVRNRAALLRQQGLSWTQIADILGAGEPNLTPRAAIRLAHGWSQAEAADRWNQRWPSELKTAKNFSYWERWPSSTGYAPSLVVLDKLAQLYECAATDLLSDSTNYAQASTDASQKTWTIEDLLGLGEELPTPLPPGLVLLTERISMVKASDVARFTSVWANQLQSEAEARLLLLKLSAGLSMAIDDQALGEAEINVLSREGSTSHHQLTGIWRSRYSFTSSTRGGDTFVGEHHVVFRQDGPLLVGESLPQIVDSRLVLRFVLDGSIATGIWRERTAPTDYYQGATYHGALQMVIDPRGRRMHGKWLGYGTDFKINAGPWELNWLDASTSKATQKRYAYRA